MSIPRSQSLSSGWGTETHLHCRLPGPLRLLAGKGGAQTTRPTVTQASGMLV